MLLCIRNSRIRDQSNNLIGDKDRTRHRNLSLEMVRPEKRDEIHIDISRYSLLELTPPARYGRSKHT